MAVIRLVYGLVPQGFEAEVQFFRERWEASVGRLEARVNTQAPRSGSHAGIDTSLLHEWMSFTWGRETKPKPKPNPPPYSEVMDPFDALEMPWERD